MYDKIIRYTLVYQNMEMREYYGKMATIMSQSRGLP